ncbi:unnamed protein product [Moneuplotes crassus]|uniref:Uncharacterized protein n=1 Tax=Euplotes crassus TaxID=5936 RepID=A0AAD2D0A1_EUPCR|nr:unnamed protein product [Moneuplotes crassus]
MNEPDDLDASETMSANPAAGLTNATMKRKKNVIGSAYNSNLNYPKDQKFFHNNDMPDKAKEAVRQVKDAFAHHDRPQWNASVSKSGLPVPDNDDAKLFSIKKGFNDFHPISIKPSKVYDGTDTRNNYDTRGWNVSNQVPIPLHDQKRIAEETAMRMTKTKEFNEKVLTNYKTPFEKAKEHSENLKLTRTMEQDWKSTIKSEIDSQMPKASEEKKQAIVMKTMYEERFKHQEHEDQHELTFKPNLSKTLVSRRKRVYHHTGKWEKSKFEDCEVWSCCMSYDKDSEGCNVRIIDPDKYNIASF